MIGKLIVILMLVLSLVACDANDAENEGEGTTPIGDAANGEALFMQPTIGPNNAPGCLTCHSLEPDVVIAGPSQAGLASRAGTRVVGQSAEEYIRNSIVNPNDYIVEGFAEGVMYQHYGEELTEEQIDDLVAFSLTLE
jgi:hypothetical protein